MKALRIALRILLAVVAGGFTFAFGSFAPLWVMMAIGKDPGDIAGGLFTLGIGLPLGLICGTAGGWFIYAKTKSLSHS